MSSEGEQEDTLKTNLNCYANWRSTILAKQDSAFPFSTGKTEGRIRLHE